MSAKLEKIKAILDEVEKNCEVDGSALVSDKGRLMSTALHSDVDEKGIAAMAAALSSIGSRVGQVLGSGEPKGLLVDGETKTIFLRKVASAVLIATAPEGSKLGLIDYELDNACSKINEVL